MPIQAPQWTEFLSCPVCCNEFDVEARGPVSLACGHSICRACLASLHRKQCPFDQSQIRLDVLKIPANSALLRLVGAVPEETDVDPTFLQSYNVPHYRRAVRCIEDLALYLRPFSSGAVSVLSRPMQRKLVTLANCQLLEAEGRARALRAARSLGERTVTELLLQHQNPQQLSANLWAAVRARGCQFLGPAMQEEVLKLVLLALEDGSALSRKVLVMFVVQRLEPHYSQASKTSIGHVVQLLYRASCFKVSKREGDSSLMQLKEEFRSYDALRREHDAQIVQIATEAGLRIAPDQWSSLLYGDTAHKSHMQSIMDKLQTPQSFAQSVQELVMALQRSGDPGGLAPLRPQLELLAVIDPSPEAAAPSWEQTAQALEAARAAVVALAEFAAAHGSRRQDLHQAPKYKVSMCRDLILRNSCPRGTNCTFAHSDQEMERFRSRTRKLEPVVRNAAYDAGGAYYPAGFSPTTLTYPPTGGVMWWLDKDRLYPRNGNALLLASCNGEPIDPADIPCTEAIIGKGGTLLQDVQNLAYENSLPCEPIMNLNMNMNLASPPWHRQPPIAVNDADAHFYVQQPEVLDQQIMKMQMRNLEKRIQDLKFAEPDQSRHDDLDDLCRMDDRLHEEELYEAGIAEDMKVLEERWECELAEQERRWSESDPRPLN